VVLSGAFDFSGEAEVPFFQASGAEFDEVYVGTGAKRIRQLFATAKVRSDSETCSVKETPGLSEEVRWDKLLSDLHCISRFYVYLPDCSRPPYVR